MIATEQPLECATDLDGTSMVLACVNRSAQPVKLWRQDNRWGWEMPRVHVGTGPDSSRWLTLVPAHRVWTANLPEYRVLQPGDATAYVLGGADLDPGSVDQVRHLWNETLWVRGELRCETTPESVELGIWQGTVASPATRSDPPHHWLPGSTDTGP